MCVIIIDPAGRELDFGILKRAVERNPDGWGIGVIIPGVNGAEPTMKIHKGFGYDGARRAWKKYAGHKRVFHARIGTSGTKDLSNCHPFYAGTMKDGAPEHRWFFHNGTVSFPRFNDAYCDSYHLAKYIQGWPTGTPLHDAISAYAKKERSRFVFMFGNEIWRYGEGWLQRDGFYYSNASALADIKYHGAHANARGSYCDGLLDPKHGEVTADSYVSGFFKIKDGLWSNIKPAGHIETPRSSQWDYTGYGDDFTGGRVYDRASGTWKPAGRGIVPGSRLPNIQTGSGVKGGTTPPAAGTPAANASSAELERAIDELESRRRRLGLKGGRGNFDADTFPFASNDLDVDTEESIIAAWRGTIIKQMERVQWMRTDIRKWEGFQVSWPPASLFDYDDPGRYYGADRTHRIKGTEKSAWREVRFSEEGALQGSTIVEGPYPGGLVITVGNDEVEYNGTKVPIEQWREYVYNFYWPDVFGELGDDEEESDDEAVSRTLEAGGTERIVVETSPSGESIIKIVDGEPVNQLV